MATSSSGVPRTTRPSSPRDLEQDRSSDDVPGDDAPSSTDPCIEDDTPGLDSHTEPTRTVDHETLPVQQTQSLCVGDDVQIPVIHVETPTPEAILPIEVAPENSLKTPADSNKGTGVSLNGEDQKVPQRPSTAHSVELRHHFRHHSTPVSRPESESGIRDLIGTTPERQRPQLGNRANSVDAHGSIYRFPRPQLHHRAASSDHYGIHSNIARPSLYSTVNTTDQRGIHAGTLASHYEDPFRSPVASVRNQSFSSETGGPRYRPRLQSRQLSIGQQSNYTTSTRPYFSPWNPFASPVMSSYTSSTSSHLSSARKASKDYFRSRRIQKGVTERPELKKKHPMQIWVNIIPIMGILVGLGIIALLTWTGIHSVTNHKYCSVLYDDFSHGFNPHIWKQEVELGTYEDGGFERTTGNNSNVFIRDGHLVIKPTLVDTADIIVDSTLNLTADGTCTSDVASDCVFTSNVTGHDIIPPVLSGRISTRQSVGITYGRVEVEARLAAGDWLLPAIYMSPVNNTYGSWPKSGEIDIAMSRGNNYTYVAGGNNVLSSTLHWGPNTEADGWYRTTANVTAHLSSYPAQFHTFALEWSEKYMFTYIDSRLRQAMYAGFGTDLWTLGNFPLVDSNGVDITDPWTSSPNLNAPFDQEFYLILGIAVGGTNGWFVDGKDSKPWSDSSATARYDFWAARDQWLPTWEAEGAGEMEIRRVRMWKQCD